MSISDYAGNNVLNSLLRGVALPLPSHIYVALHTGDPGRSGAANEVTTGIFPSYVRKVADGGGAIAAGFSASTTRQSSNLVQMYWPAMDGTGPITITHWSLWDASTGGNMLLYGPLDTPSVVSNSNVFLIDTGKLIVADA